MPEWYLNVSDRPYLWWNILSNGNKLSLFQHYFYQTLILWGRSRQLWPTGYCPSGDNNNGKHATCYTRQGWNCGIFPCKRKKHYTISFLFPPSLGALWVIAISGIRNKQKTGHVQFHGSKWMQELWASQVISFGFCLAVTVMEAVHHPQDNNCMRSAKTGLDDSFLFGGVMGELLSGFHWCFCSCVFLTHDRWTTL